MPTVKDEQDATKHSGGLWRWGWKVGWYPVQERRMVLGVKSYLGLLMCKLGQHPAWEWLNLEQQGEQGWHMKCVRCGKEKWVLAYDASVENRADQLNPDHEAYEASRENDEEEE